MKYIKKSWFFLIFLTNLIASEAEYTIVFVHLGPETPLKVPVTTHITSAIQQARLFNKYCPIYLISNEKIINQIQSKISDDLFKCVDYTQLKVSKEHQNFLNNNNKKRKGFWLYTIERFLYLYEFAEAYKLKNIFHIENDVMLYADVGKFMPLIEHENKSTWMVADSDSRCIASLIYFRDEEALQHLANFFSGRLPDNLNDIELFGVYKKFSSERVGQFPIIFDAYLKDFPLTNTLGNIAADPSAYCKYYRDFDYIFDAAAIGQYIGGLDPIHHNSKPGFINETCIINPSRLNYSVRYDSENLAVPIATYDGKAYKIANLHIHSKRLSDFSSIGTTLANELKKIVDQQPWGPQIKNITKPIQKSTKTSKKYV